MRYISWVLHKPLIRSLLFFMMGIYLGMFISLFLHGNQLDQLHIQNAKLQKDFNESKLYISGLEQERKQRKQNQLIKNLTFHLENKLDPFDETALLETLTAETRFIIGKNVNEVGKNPEFIYRLLNDKSFKTKDKAFLIKVKIIYIQSTTEIWLSAQEQNT